MRSSSPILAVLASLVTACSLQESAAPLLSLVDSARAGLSSEGIPGPILDPHHRGEAGEMHVTGLWWGRLADVYAVDPATGERFQIARDLVIGPEIVTDEREIELETNPITSITDVTLLAELGSSAFDAAWKRLESGLVPIQDKSADPAELPPFTKVPRDAAVVVRFDDLLDPASVGAEAIQVAVGERVLERFPARVLCDRNHGGWTGDPHVAGSRFLPTRVILDMTTSEAEALESPGAPELHTRGLPPSRTRLMPNVTLRIPTRGEGIVRNLAGSGLAASGNGNVDANSPTRDLVRAFVSGADDDPFHGLLADSTSPRIVGSQAVHIDAVAPDPQGGPQDYLAILTFETPACARPARVRDVLSFVAGMAVVTRDSPQPNGAELGRIRVRLVAGGPLAVGTGVYRAQYDPALDQGREACFLRFSPEPGAPPAQGVDPAATLVLDFSEPMDPRSVTGLETWTVTNVPSPSDPTDYVAAQVIPSVNQSNFTLVPVLPFGHVTGTSETYFVNLAAGATGPTDLAGNPLRDALPRLPFGLDPSASTLISSSYVLRFESSDEDGNGSPELRGQFLYDLSEGLIRPRSVSRFSAVADRTQPVPGLMSPIPAGVQTPLNRLGSRLHALWRYCDVGMSLLDETFTNVDIEGLNWSPVGGSVVADQYATFEMSLAHSRWLPDEILDPGTLLPEFRDSGLIARYDRNRLDPVNDPLRVVHPRARGYTVNPADAFVASTGTPMMPWPLNRNLPPGQHQYYTWRDTALQATGGDKGGGAELNIVVAATGTGTPGVPYPAGLVRSIGLPLLMEFKCFPDQSALGLNLLDASIAVNSSSMPNFRAFSSGGTNSSGIPVTIDPDQETVATGGFNPASNPPGQRTLGVENTFYIGQMDLVVRVSRVHSVWIDTHGATASYAPSVIEPVPSEQPVGTQIVLAYRGATAASAGVLADAGFLDAYGEASAPEGVTFFDGDASWKSDITRLDGARFLQVRATFISNAETSAIPRLSAMGLSFRQP